MMEQCRLSEFDLGNGRDNDVIKQKLIEIFGEDVVKSIDFVNLKNKKDIISTIYETVLDKKERKKFAQFFTHSELIHFLIDKIPIRKDANILDPACGAGAFLLQLAESRNLKLENLYGIDIDNTALDMCKINLLDFPGYAHSNLINANTILESDLETLFPDIFAKGGFDIVIGNPPFQNLKKNIDYKEDESFYRQVLSGVANSASLMIAKAFEFLKDGGYLGFVLPKSIFRVRSFKSLRKFLIENTKLIHIYDIDHYFKDVRGDQVLLVFQKKKLTSAEMKTHQVKIYIHKKGLSFDCPYTYVTSQSKFLNYEYFPIFYHQDIIKLEQKFRRIEENFETISEGNIFRGLDISMNSGLVLKEQREEYRKVYRGDSISRFGIKYPLYIEKDSLQEISKSRIKRLSNNKIILQNITSKEGGIYATLSTKDELTLDTVTNILVDESLLKYCVGVLNSNITNFYVTFIVFLNSNFTMHTDRTYIGKIPIIIPKIEKRKEVESVVDSLMQIENKFSKEFFDSYDKLNEKLFDIYSFNTHEQKRMRELLTEVMSRKHNGR